MESFVRYYLHRDGILVLRMISSHAGAIVTADLVFLLWKIYFTFENSVSDYLIATISLQNGKSIRDEGSVDDKLLVKKFAQKKKNSVEVCLGLFETFSWTKMIGTRPRSMFSLLLLATGETLTRAKRKRVHYPCPTLTTIDTEVFSFLLPFAFVFS